MTATATEPTSRKSGGVHLFNENGRRIAEVLCYDKRLGAVLVVYTDGEFQSADATNETDIRCLDGNNYVDALPVIERLALTIITDEGKYHRFPVRR